jgi:hypothetical protein
MTTMGSRDLFRDFPQASRSRTSSSGLQPPDAALRLLLQPDLRDRCQHLPLLVRQPEEMPEQGQRAVDGSSGQELPRPLGLLAQAPCLVLADGGGGDRGEGRVRTKVELEAFEVPLVANEIPLPSLRSEVALGCVLQRDTAHRDWRLYVEQRLCEGRLRVLLAPVRLV